MKFQIKQTLLVAVSALVFASCTAPTANAIDMDKLKVEIQALEDAFSAAEKAKDADAVAAYYADDAVSYGRNKEPIVGKAAIHENIAKNIAEDSTGDYSVYKVVDLFADGNMAVEIGSWNQFNAAGEPKENGHYMSYFQNRDGKWLCIRDMSVSSMPVKK